MILTVKILIYLDGLLLLGLIFFRWALVDRMKSQIGARVYALTLLIPALLLAVPNVELAYLILVVAAMLANNRPELCAGYLLMMPMVPELSLEYGIGGVYIGRLSSMEALGIGALLSLLWTKRVSTARATGKYDAAMVALVLLFTIINARGENANEYLRAFTENIFMIGAPYIISSRCIGSEKDAGIVLSRFYLAGVLTALVAVFETTRHWALYDAIPSHLGVHMLDAPELNMRAGFMRAGGPFLNPTAFALFLAILPPGLWAIRSYFKTLGYWAVMALLLLGLLATQSRGAWVACIAGFCALWAYRGMRYKVFGALVSFVVFYAASALLPESGRLAESLGRTGGAADTADYRRLLLQRGLEQFYAHPLLGQSGAALRSAMVELVQGQGIVDFVNGHLFVALGSGFVGFTIWIVIWGTPFVTSCRSGTPISRAAITKLQLVPETMLVVSIVGLCFTSTASRALVWPTLALGLTGPMLAMARRTESLSIKPRVLSSEDFDCGVSKASISG